MIIKSSTALRNDYGTISDLAHDEGEPIYITKNGEGDLVVMSIEAFEQREEALKLRAKLEAAETAGSPARPPIPWRSPERGWRGSIAMAELVILEPAQRELEEIAQLHMNLEGPASARRITDLILDTLSRLERFPLSGHIPRDRELRGGGYRYVIAGKYICVYRLMAERVYVYHIAHGASNYPALFKRLRREEP